MNIQKRTVQLVNIIDLQGRLDAHQSNRVDEFLMQQVVEGSRTLVNLRHVHFIDSTGLAILVKAVKRHREQNGEMLLCELQQPVKIILELTRLDRVFDIYATETDALQALQPQAMPA